MQFCRRLCKLNYIERARHKFGEDIPTTHLLIEIVSKNRPKDHKGSGRSG